MPKLLLVDDDETLRRLMRLELSDDYEIVDSGEPEQGLALAMEHKPDAIVLDLRMPKYSGYELCQTFTSLSRTQMIPVIIVSGEAGTQTKEYCMRLGAAGYFEKPVDFAALRACLSHLAVQRRHAPQGELRVPLRVSLKLQGTDINGAKFEEVTATELVSPNGFLCTSKTQIPLHSVVDVSMTGNGNAYVGKVSIVEADCTTAPLRRYGCCFVEKTGPWVLQQ